MENNNFSNFIIGTDERIKGSIRGVITGFSRAVAVLAAVVALLVSFTELTFTEFGANDLTPTLAVMLVCSYLMYFSLEAAGEEAGMASDEYISAVSRFKAAKERIKPGMIEPLRSFCTEYSRRELEYRRSAYLISSGSTPKEYEAYKNGAAFNSRARRVFRKYERIHPTLITPAMLLGGGSVSKSGELRDPERTKIVILAARLLPTTVCMIFTASVMMSFKGGLTPESVMETLLKLSTLPMVAFKGYTSGYNYIRDRGLEWTVTRTRILESFIESVGAQADSRRDKQEGTGA